MPHSSGDDSACSRPDHGTEPTDAVRLRLEHNDLRCEHTTPNDSSFGGSLSCVALKTLFRLDLVSYCVPTSPRTYPLDLVALRLHRMMMMKSDLGADIGYVLVAGPTDLTEVVLMAESLAGRDAEGAIGALWYETLPLGSPEHLVRKRQDQLRELDSLGVLCTGVSELNLGSVPDGPRYTAFVTIEDGNQTLSPVAAFFDAVSSWCCITLREENYTATLSQRYQEGYIPVLAWHPSDVDVYVNVVRAPSLSPYTPVAPHQLRRAVRTMNSRVLRSISREGLCYGCQAIRDFLKGTRFGSFTLSAKYALTRQDGTSSGSDADDDD